VEETITDKQVWARIGITIACLVGLMTAAIVTANLLG